MNGELISLLRRGEVTHVAKPITEEQNSSRTRVIVDEQRRVAEEMSRHRGRQSEWHYSIRSFILRQ